MVVVTLCLGWKLMAKEENGIKLVGVLGEFCAFRIRVLVGIDVIFSLIWAMMIVW